MGGSHGPAIGCVIDGVPPLVDMSEAVIQPFGQTQTRAKPIYHPTQEADQVQILSGVFEGKTTGCPHLSNHWNTDQRSKDYGDIAKNSAPVMRIIPININMGFTDYRGGGRSSARETASRVAAGAVARTALNTLVDGGVTIQGAWYKSAPAIIGTIGIGTGFAKSVFLPRAETVPVWKNIYTLFARMDYPRRGDRGCGNGSSRRVRARHLSKIRQWFIHCHDDHQRGQGWKWPWV